MASEMEVDAVLNGSNEGPAASAGAVTAPEAAETAPPDAAPKKQRFEIKKWSAVAFWSWDISIDTCAICRNHIMDVCIDCQANLGSNADDCTVSWGVCKHIFHSHCIQRWLSSRPVCPLDNQPWELAKCGH